jgi:hypothetical protein
MRAFFYTFFYTKAIFWRKLVKSLEKPEKQNAFGFSYL